MDLNYVSMKPHYCINDFYIGFNSEIKFDYRKDKETIDRVCELIPLIFKELINQSDEYFIDNWDVAKKKGTSIE